MVQSLSKVRAIALEAAGSRFYSGIANLKVEAASCRFSVVKAAPRHFSFGIARFL